MTGRTAAGRHASSYAAELTAILSATRTLLRRTAAGAGEWTHPRVRVRFCTDSRSALQAIATGPSTRSDSLFTATWTALTALARRCDVLLQWVPAHCGISGNEEADLQAASASDLEQRRVPVAFDAAQAVVKRTVRRRWLDSPQPEWHRRAAGSVPDLTTADSLPRADAVTVTQLRTGHCVLLRSYRHRIGLDPSPSCTDCGFDDPDTAEHFLLLCPAHHHLRQRLFSSPSLSDPFPIFARPSDVADFIRRAGRFRPRL